MDRPSPPSTLLCFLPASQQTPDGANKLKKMLIFSHVTWFIQHWAVLVHVVCVCSGWFYLFCKGAGWGTLVVWAIFGFFLAHSLSFCWLKKPKKPTRRGQQQNRPGFMR